MKKLLVATALSGFLAVNPLMATTQQGVVNTYADIVKSNYSDSLQSAQRMQQQIQAFLDNPTAKTLATAKEAWTTARRPYLETEVFRFYEGPIDSGDMNLEGRINAWPLNEGFIDYVEDRPDAGIVNSDKPITIEAILKQDQVTDEADVTTGWHAIEFLLWGQDLSNDGPGNRPYTDYVKGEKDNERRRQYLELVTQQLIDDLQYLNSQWGKSYKNYRTEFVKTPEASLTNIITALATLSGFELSAERLAVPLESSSQEDEHSCFSDTTHQDYIHNQKGIENVYFGRYGFSPETRMPANNVSGEGIHDLLKKKNPKLAAKLAAQLQETSVYLKQIQSPFDQVLASPVGSDLRKPAEMALASMEKQADLFVEAGKALGLDVEILAE